jgi:hypothetical protein
MLMSSSSRRAQWVQAAAPVRLLESKRVIHQPQESALRCRPRRVAGCAKPYTCCAGSRATALGATAAAFTGFDSKRPAFNITSATPAYDLQTDGYSITVQYSRTSQRELQPLRQQPITVSLPPMPPRALSHHQRLRPALPSGTNAYRLTLGSGYGCEHSV